MLLVMLLCRLQLYLLFSVSCSCKFCVCSFAFHLIIMILCRIATKHIFYRAGPAIGLILIALGTGGIKPCVSAFGGDQFEAGQVKIDFLFTYFY